MMYKEIFYHSLSDGQPAKFSIWKTIIDNNTYYYAKVIGTDLDFYTQLTEHQKETTFGVNVTDGNQGVVYDSNPEKLKSDIIAKYGDDWLVSER